MVQASHMLAEPEYTINFTLRRTLQSILSVPGQKFSKHTLLLVEDVNSPASQRSPQNKGHYSSQRSTVLSTWLIVARSRIPPTCSAFSTAGSVCYQHSLPLGAGILSLCGSCLIAKSSKFSIFQQSFVPSPLLVLADWRGSDGQMVSVSGAFVKLTLYLCSEWENNKRSK